MEITKNFENGVLSLALRGRLDTTTAPQFEAELAPSLPEAKNVILDFEGLEYISSAGLRLLLMAKKALPAGGDVTVRHACADILEIFDITGFADLLILED